MNKNKEIFNNGFSRMFADFLGFNITNKVNSQKLISANSAPLRDKKIISRRGAEFAEIFKNVPNSNSFHLFKNLRKSAFSALICVLFFLSVSNIFAQDLPDKIRGYKVHKAKISVKNEREKTENTKDKNEAFVKINDPEVYDISLSGITFELEAELSSIEESGTVDFLSFHDFRVNGLKVNVEEYKESFDFKKNSPVILPKPFKIFLGTGQALSGALKEFKDSKEEWRVTGRVFVFGQFKKSFLKFKRVVLVDIDILIKNPIKELAGKQKTNTEN